MFEAGFAFAAAFEVEGRVPGELEEDVGMTAGLRAAGNEFEILDRRLFGLRELTARDEDRSHHRQRGDRAASAWS